MKRNKLIYLSLAIILVLAPILALVGCNPTPVAPGAEPSSLIPTSNNTYDVGTISKQWRDTYVGRDLTVGRNTTFTSNVTGGTYLTSTLTSPTITSPTVTGGTFTGTGATTFSANATPTANNTYNLGSASLLWSNIFVGTTNTTTLAIVSGNTTGGFSANFTGNNAPNALTQTTVHTWLTIKLGDGTSVYVPAWK